MIRYRFFFDFSYKEVLMKVFPEVGLSRREVMSWCPEIEDSAKVQVKNLSSLPFIHNHVAVMPDCHTGYGMPIGGVIMTKGVVIPNAVGVDIGCGMTAVKLPINRDTHPTFGTTDLKFIMDIIRDEVPVGFKKHKYPQETKYMPKGLAGPVAKREYINALKSMGTLGGGNHFIEIQIDEDTNIWVMVHSGSRNLGKQVADHYNNLAVELNEKYYSQVDKKSELAFLPLNTIEGLDYIREMDYCVQFAKANRKLMLQRIVEIFYRHIELTEDTDEPIECCHNYAAVEHHLGLNGWVHRKGATRAREGELGIIPGSQGTKSYIVKGRGNKLSFMSCSHGAGRIMGRNQARKTLSLEAEQQKLDTQGILHSIRDTKDLDEATSAYKDIDTVMANQTDLVDVVHTLKPIAVIKG
jgi:tRNA-splicing ligase RtcB